MQVIKLILIHTQHNLKEIIVENITFVPQLIVSVALTLFLFNMLTTFVALVLSYLIKFWTRGRKRPKFATNLLNFKYTSIKKCIHGGNKPISAGDLWFFYEFLMCIIFYVVTTVIVTTAGLFGLVGVVVAIILTIAPRYLLDITHTLKYNNKTHDSERLADLEQEIKILKEKQS